MDKYDEIKNSPSVSYALKTLAEMCRQKDGELERAKTEIGKLEQMFDELMVIKQKIIDDLEARIVELNKRMEGK